MFYLELVGSKQTAAVSIKGNRATEMPALLVPAELCIEWTEQCVTENLLDLILWYTIGWLLYLDPDSGLFRA